MKRLLKFSFLATLALNTHQTIASTAYGDLNNFDAVNDTGQDCHGFEIEIDDARSMDVTYTYDWNHYGAPTIREDLTDPLHPKVYVRYASSKNADGSWSAYTAMPATPLTPTDGHSCTNPAVNDGCEHFGVGYYNVPSAIKYNWLVDDGAGNLVLGPAVAVATPTWTYSPPIPPDPFNPMGVPANVVANIPAPELPIPPLKEFGPPQWMKVIKTTTHNANPVALGDLISDDINGDGEADWQNGEPDEVETEWFLVQNQLNGGDGLDGAADDMGDGSEVVTRRYEFYDYNDPNPIGLGSIDGENGEAKCDQVAADNIHGVGTVTVTNAAGDDYNFDCGALAVVGNYIGAQMAAFAADAPLGLVDNLPQGDNGQPYTPRVVIVGGNTPYTITVSGLPIGMSLDTYTDTDSGDSREGVLFGTPTASGDFNVTVDATDASNAHVSKNYTLHIAGQNPPPQNHAPIANDQPVGTAEDTATNIILGASDQDGDSLSYSLIAQPSHGNLSGVAPNLSYTPELNYNGTDSFTFKANDGHLDSNIATVNITITAANDLPSPGDDSARTYPNTSVTINVLANDTDVDGNPLTVSAVTSPAHGTIVNNGSDVSYKPNRRFSGNDSFNYTVSDGQGGSASATVSVLVAANQSPAAANDSVSTPVNTAVIIDVLANDSDPDGDTLSVSSVSRPKRGSAAISNNAVTYTPKANTTGTDSFKYTISDGHGGQASAIVIVTVN